MTILQILISFMLLCFANLLPSVSYAIICPKTMATFDSIDICNEVCGGGCIDDNTMKCGSYDYIKGQDVVFACDKTAYCPGGNYACDPSGNCKVPESCTNPSGPPNFMCTLTNKTFVGSNECTGNCSYDYFVCNWPGKAKNQNDPTAPYDGKIYAAYTENTGSNPSTWTLQPNYDPYVECTNNCVVPNGCIERTETKAQYQCVSNGTIYTTLNDCSSNCFEQPSAPVWDCTDPNVKTIFLSKTSCEDACDLSKFTCAEHIYQSLFECSNHNLKGIYPSKEQCEVDCYGNRFMCFSNQKDYATVDDCHADCKAECIKQTDADGTGYYGYSCKSTPDVPPYYGNTTESLDLSACQANCPTIGSGGTCKEKMELLDTFECPINGFKSINQQFCQANCFQYTCNVDTNVPPTPYTSLTDCKNACVGNQLEYAFCDRETTTTNALGGPAGYRCTWTGAQPCNRNPSSGAYISYVCGLDGVSFSGHGIAKDYDNCMNYCKPAPNQLNETDFGNNLAACEDACTENRTDVYLCEGSGNNLVDGTYYQTEQDCADQCVKCPTELGLDGMIIRADPYFYPHTNGQDNPGDLKYGCRGYSAPLQCMQQAWKKSSVPPPGYNAETAWNKFDIAQWAYAGGGFNSETCSIPIAFEYAYAAGDVSLNTNPCDCRSDFFSGGTCCACNCKTYTATIDLRIHGVCSHVPLVTIPHSCSNEYYTGFRCPVDQTVFENAGASDSHLAAFNPATEDTDYLNCNNRCSAYPKGQCKGSQGPTCTNAGKTETYQGWNCITYEGVISTTFTGPNNSAVDQQTCQTDCEQALSDCTQALRSDKCVPLDLSTR